MHRAVCCSCCQIPPHLYYFFISTIIISCYATLQLMSFFHSLLVAIMYNAFLFVPIVYCYSTPFIFVFVSNPVLWCPCLFPLPRAYLYMVFDCSFIVYSSIQSPTKCPSPHFFLCLCILTFLH